MEAVKSSQARLASQRFKKADDDAVNEAGFGARKSGAKSVEPPKRVRPLKPVVLRSESSMTEKARAGKAVLLAHEAEGLLAQIEEVAHAAGFGGDTDFGRMTNGLREVHKTGACNLERSTAFHVLVKDALAATTVQDKIAALTRCDAWYAEVLKTEKRRAREEKRKRKADRNEKRIQRQIREAAVAQQQDIKRHEEEKQAKRVAAFKKKVKAEQGQRQREAKEWRKRQEQKKLEEAEAEKADLLKRQSDSLERRKLLQVRRRAEKEAAWAAKQREEANQAHMAALAERARVDTLRAKTEEKRAEEIESEISRRVQEEVQRQLRTAMEEGGLFSRLELEMHDAAHKAKNWEKQSRAQRPGDEAYVIEEEGSSIPEEEDEGWRREGEEDEAAIGAIMGGEAEVPEEDEEAELGDYASTDDEGLQHAPMPRGAALQGQPFSQFRAAPEDDDEEELEIPEEPFPESFEEAYARFNERKDAEERRTGGGPAGGSGSPPPGLDLSSPRVKARLADGAVAAETEPMTPSFWAGRGEQDDDGSGGGGANKSRVGAAVERARRMAIAAQERASARAAAWEADPPLDQEAARSLPHQAPVPPVAHPTKAPTSTNAAVREHEEHRQRERLEVGKAGSPGYA